MIYLAFSKVSEILRLTWTAKPNECPTGAWDIEASGSSLGDTPKRGGTDHSLG